MTEYMYNAEEQKKIDDAVDEAVASFQRQKTIEASEKEHRKDIYENLKEKNVPIDKKLFNSLVNERFDGKSSDIISKHEDVVALDEILRNTKAQEE